MAKLTIVLLASWQNGFKQIVALMFRVGMNYNLDIFIEENGEKTTRTERQNLVDICKNVSE